MKPARQISSTPWASSTACDDFHGRSRGLRLFKSRRIGTVGNDDGNLGGEIRIHCGLDQRGHVRPAAGDEDRDAALHGFTG
jgi:hypothetical protein